MDAREPFLRLIGDMAPGGAAALDWFATAPGARNTLCSQFFFRCCGLLLVRELARRGESPETVTTDSPAQALLLSALFTQRPRAPEILTAAPAGSRKHLRPPYAVALADLALCLWTWTWARLTRSRARPLPDDAPLLLLDTFLAAGDPDHDHYYPGLLEHLDDDARRRTVFAATVAGVGFAGLPGVFSRLRRARRNLLPREDFLTLGDCFAAWRRALKTAQLPLAPARFEGMDVATLAREELSRLTAFDGILGAFLNERFAFRLAAAGVRLATVVDWFENQAVDKGFNAGFRRYFPKARHLGYLGFLTSPLYLCQSPSPAEERAGVLPGELRGIGPGSAEIMSEFLPEKPFAPAPAFRYRKALEASDSPPPRKPFTVLVSLPLPMADSVGVLRAVVAILDQLPVDVSVLVKRHPLVAEASLRHALGLPWPRRLQCVDGTFDTCIRRSHVQVSLTSSTSLEAVARGVPVIIVANARGLTWNPVPASCAPCLHRLVRSPQALLAAILELHGQGPEQARLRQEAGKVFRERYFTPVSRETVHAFLGLSAASRTS
ncbi:hypothetical protein [Solidesulfovibrio sp.]|uniref:hypothetical protein n=1 Tax=Solidesulfovibrio sp. TaxID=2910990 RepID=UPI002B1F42BB|nr:hypothetical protein [Solidesulfovibrio sp.]MEA5089413.1 hypothetical protein [Solidesulfovibrio sp.]